MNIARSAALSNVGILVKNGYTCLYGWSITNQSAVASITVKFYDKLAPTVGTDVPKFTITIPQAQIATFGPPSLFTAEFTTACFVAATVEATDAGATVPAASVNANFFYV
jgi:hypothetical protein